MSAVRFLDDGDDGQDAILDRVMELVLGGLNTTRDTLNAVEWSLGEIGQRDRVRAVASGRVRAGASTSKRSESSRAVSQTSSSNGCSWGWDRGRSWPASAWSTSPQPSGA